MKTLHEKINETLLEYESEPNFVCASIIVKITEETATGFLEWTDVNFSANFDKLWYANTNSESISPEGLTTMELFQLYLKSKKVKNKKLEARRQS